MNAGKWKIENMVYLAAGLLALAARLMALGRLPLSDSEARLALQALDVARGNLVTLDPQPGYILPTALLFFLFESSNFLARFWPALAGSLLAVAPFFFRRDLGRAPALILAFVLALEPGLVAVSRQAGAAMMAVAFVLLALGCWRDNRVLAAGIFGGLALLSGPALWTGLIVVAVVAFLWPQTPLEGDEAATPSALPDRRLVFGAALVTLFAVGTLFFSAPRGLSAAAGSLPAYLAGWVQSGTPAYLLALALVVYSLPGLIFGLWGAVYGLVRGVQVDRALAAGMAASLLLVFLKAGRQPADLIWALPLLWALAARQLARLLPLEDQDGLAVAAQAVLSFVLIVFSWLNFAAVYAPVLGNSESLVRLAAVAGALLLLLLSSLLMGVGWSWDAMRTGLVWGIGLALAIFTLSGTYKASGLAGNPSAEIWQLHNGASSPRNAALVMDTIGDMAMWQSGGRTLTDVTVVGVQSPALEWALRNMEALHIVNFLPVESSASVVITSQQDELALSNAYRGQDFAWDQSVQWSAMTLEEWFAWLLVHRAPVSSSSIIVWGRADIFADGGQTVTAPTTP